MNITKWEKPEGSGSLVRVTTQEAIRLIRSLAQQIEENGSEQGRAEFQTDNNEYFSVVVRDIVKTELLDEKPPPDGCGDCGNWLGKCVCGDVTIESKGDGDET